MNQRVTQRLNEGGLNPGDIIQAPQAISDTAAQHFINASPATQQANSATGGALALAGLVSLGFSMYLGLLGPQTAGVSAARDTSGAVGALGDDAQTLIKAGASPGDAPLQALTQRVASASVPADITPAQVADARSTIADARQMLANGAIPQDQRSGVQALADQLEQRLPQTPDTTAVGSTTKTPASSASALPTDAQSTTVPTRVSGLQSCVSDLQCCDLQSSPAFTAARPLDQVHMLEDTLNGTEPQPPVRFTADGQQVPSSGASATASATDPMYEQTELNAGLTPGSVGRPLDALTKPRTGDVGTAQAAPKDIQDALNTLDSQVRGSRTRIDTLQRQLTADPTGTAQRFGMSVDDTRSLLQSMEGHVKQQPTELPQ